MCDEHVDVLIIGAGLSGIGAGCRLRQKCPGKTFAILEARGAIGGTWDLFRFPGVRSDSDMFTLGYPFRPWSGERAIVDGRSILEYVRDTAREYGLDRLIRCHHRVVGADWSSADARWTVEVQRGDTGETERLTCGFLFSCTGYYRYDAGYTPAFEDIERFAGEIVHPQAWPDEIDYDGKRVVVIGSGATAVTLVPVLAKRAAHVTMVQRSPSYVMSVPTRDPLAEPLARLLPARVAYEILRWANALAMIAIYALSRRRPRTMKRLLRRAAARQLPPGYDVDTHFNPRYDPWDQRMCVAADGDLFEAIRDGRASIVTDRITRFTEAGLELASGVELEADLVVTATGLELLPFGGIRLSVDGATVELPATVAYRGMMLSGVPNMAYAFGYANQSWTLGSDLTSVQVCSLLNHMDRHGYAACIPRPGDQVVGSQPLTELRSGYVLRAGNRFPHQGSRHPWRRQPNYLRNRISMRTSPVEKDPALEFVRADAATRVLAALPA